MLLVALLASLRVQLKFLFHLLSAVVPLKVEKATYQVQLLSPLLSSIDLQRSFF